MLHEIRIKPGWRAWRAERMAVRGKIAFLLIREAEIAARRGARGRAICKATGKGTGRGSNLDSTGVSAIFIEGKASSGPERASSLSDCRGRR